MIGSRLDFDPRAELQDVTALLTALQNGTPLPDVTGKAKDLPDKVNQLNISLQVLNTGAQMLAEGAASLNTGLKELSANSEALNTGADAVFAAILETANKQLAASGLAEAGIQVPELTAGNYADILGALVTKLEGATGTAAGRKAHDTLQGLLDQLNEVNSFVTGLKTYTAGVDRAAAGSAEISAGAAALHDNGTDALQAAILAAEKAAAGKLLPVLTGDAAALLDEYSRMTGQETGYDLHGEGWGTDALYVIRTDLQ
jgi:putative membrane protein